MKPEDSPFEVGWWMNGFYGYRDCDGTYCLFDYHTLPPLPPADDDFAWMTVSDAIKERSAIYHPDYSAIGEDLAHAQANLAAAGITLPPTFTRLIGQPERLYHFPAMAAGYFDIREPLRRPDGAWLQPFFIDQQGAPVWSLYLLPDGDHAVVTERETTYHRDNPSPEFVAETTYVGEGFLPFIYRFWFENHIGFKQFVDETLTEAERAYLAH